jgi:hypothetical protein
MNTSNLPGLLISSLLLCACSGDASPATQPGTPETTDDTSNTGAVSGDANATTAQDGEGPLGPDTPCVGQTCGPTDCSVIDNGCGLEMDCGGCPDGIICGAHGVPNECEVICDKVTCASTGAACGTLPDGCGGTLDCGDCTDGTFCGANGTPNS